jgi:hypothetical protein
MKERFVWVAFIVACGGAGATEQPSTSASASATSTPDTPCWPVAAMRLVTREHGGQWEPRVEMQGDGSIYVLRDGGRQFMGRLSNDALLDKHDTPSLTCVHREVGLPGSAVTGHYDETDAFVDKRTRIAVADDGTITMTLGAHADSSNEVRVEGPIVKMRRTAVLLVLAAASR